ncbi:hypothetical protein ACE6H2_025096 [Prunus campanulata]
MLGDDLPAATEAALEALRGKEIDVSLGIRNEDLPQLAGSVDAVNSWFATNVEPYLNDIVFSYISVGNEVIPMEKVGGANVDVVVSESGWPSDGNGNFTTPELAGTYNRNFLEHITSKAGTPKRPGAYIEGYIFAMFNENQKPEGVEQHFGLFHPNMQPVYPVF